MSELVGARALPQFLDLRAATPLHGELSAARGQPLTLDASSVERVGGLCVQVLLAAKAAWMADGVAFQIAAPSPGFIEGLEVMAAQHLINDGSAN